MMIYLFRENLVTTAKLDLLDQADLRVSLVINMFVFVTCRYLS